MKLAHVGYVLTDQEFAAEKGGDLPYLLSVFSDPINIILMIAGVLVVIGGYVLFTRSTKCRDFMKGLRKHEKDYRQLFPWMARLAIGIALVGAGSSSVLLTPALGVDSLSGFVQMLVGFALLAGIATFPAVLVAVILFIFAVTQDPYYLGNLDYLALLAALLIWGDARPGVDHLFGVGMPTELQKYSPHVNFILRIGIGCSMIYLAIVEKLLNPHAMELVVSRYDLVHVIPVSLEMWVFSTGVIEFLIGVALLVGFKTRLVSAVALFVLTLSFFFFGEEVYSHVTLFGTLSILFVMGSGLWSVDERMKSEIC